jgi:hypothetical protein
MRRVMLLLLAASLVTPAAGQDAPPVAGPAPAPTVERRLGDWMSRRPVKGLAASHDGKWIAAADGAGNVCLFSTTSAERKVLHQLDPAAMSLADMSTTSFPFLSFTADSAFVVAVALPSETGHLVLTYPVPDGKPVRRIEVGKGEAPSRGQVGPPMINRALAGSAGSSFYVLRSGRYETWDAATGTKCAATDADLESAASPDGALEAGTSADGVWFQGAGGAKRRFVIDARKTKLFEDCRVLHFSEDGRFLFVFTATRPGPGKGASSKRRIEAYATFDGAAAWKCDLNDGADVLTIRPASHALVYLENGSLVVLNDATGQVRETKRAKYTCLATSPDGLIVWAGGEDGRIAQAKTFEK